MAINIVEEADRRIIANDFDYEFKIVAIATDEGWTATWDAKPDALRTWYHAKTRKAAIARALYSVLGSFLEG